MNIEDLKEQLQVRWSEVQESPAYNSIKEKYDTLSPDAQKALTVVVIGLFAFLLFSIPYSYISSSQENILRFEDDRALIRELLRVGPPKGGAVGLPNSMSVEDISARLNPILERFQLLPDQTGGFSEAENTMTIAPKPIQQTAAFLTLINLNLRQIVDIGMAIQKKSNAVKLLGVQIMASGDKPNYFDVKYKLVGFSMPEVSDKKNSKRNQRKRK